jgi:hypothetical protein
MEAPFFLCFVVEVHGGSEHLIRITFNMDELSCREKFEQLVDARGVGRVLE